MELNSRPSLSKDAVRLLGIASQHCYSDTVSGLIIEITTVFLHSKTLISVPTVAPAPEAILSTSEDFEPLPEVNLEGFENLEFLE